jgi:hypothetical protein
MSIAKIKYFLKVFDLSNFTLIFLLMFFDVDLLIGFFDKSYNH